MPFNFEETVKQLTDFMKTEAKTETVIGQTFQLGEFSCVPVIKFGMVLDMEEGKVMVMLPEKVKVKEQAAARWRYWG
jgi:hypothetical protein